MKLVELVSVAVVVVMMELAVAVKLKEMEENSLGNLKQNELARMTQEFPVSVNPIMPPKPYIYSFYDPKKSPDELISCSDVNAAKNLVSMVDGSECDGTCMKCAKAIVKFVIARAKNSCGEVRAREVARKEEKMHAVCVAAYSNWKDFDGAGLFSSLQLEPEPLYSNADIWLLNTFEAPRVCAIECKSNDGTAIGRDYETFQFYPGLCKALAYVAHYKADYQEPMDCTST